MRNLFSKYLQRIVKRLNGVHTYLTVLCTTLHRNTQTQTGICMENVMGL